MAETIGEFLWEINTDDSGLRRGIKESEKTMQTWGRTAVRPHESIIDANRRLDRSFSIVSRSVRSLGVEATGSIGRAISLVTVLVDRLSDLRVIGLQAERRAGSGFDPSPLLAGATLATLANRRPGIASASAASQATGNAELMRQALTNQMNALGPEGLTGRARGPGGRFVSLESTRLPFNALSRTRTLTNEANATAAITPGGYGAAVTAVGDLDRTAKRASDSIGKLASAALVGASAIGGFLTGRGIRDWLVSNSSVARNLLPGGKADFERISNEEATKNQDIATAQREALLKTIRPINTEAEANRRGLRGIARQEFVLRDEEPMLRNAKINLLKSELISARKLKEETDRAVRLAAATNAWMMEREQAEERAAQAFEQAVAEESERRSIEGQAANSRIANQIANRPVYQLNTAIQSNLDAARGRRGLLQEAANQIRSGLNPEGVIGALHSLGVDTSFLQRTPSIGGGIRSPGELGLTRFQSPRSGVVDPGDLNRREEIKVLKDTKRILERIFLEIQRGGGGLS